MGFSHEPWKFLRPESPVILESSELFPIGRDVKGPVTPDMFEIRRLEDHVLEDLHVSLEKTHQQMGTKLLELQDQYIQHCARELGKTIKEVVENFRVESAHSHPVLGHPLPTSSNEYIIEYTFRLVPRINGH